MFRMGEIMKNQQKASKQKIKALKYNSCRFMALWYEKTLPRKKNQLFWKAPHGQFCIFIPPFVERYGTWFIEDNTLWGNHEARILPSSSVCRFQSNGTMSRPIRMPSPIANSNSPSHGAKRQSNNG